MYKYVFDENLFVVICEIFWSNILVGIDLSLLLWLLYNNKID